MAGTIEVYYWTQDGAEYEADNYLIAKDKAREAHGQVLCYTYEFSDSELIDDYTYDDAKDDIDKLRDEQGWSDNQITDYLERSEDER